MFGCFFFQAEDGIRDLTVTGVQTCALPIWLGLTLQPTSPAIHKGIDPSTIAGLDSAIASDLKRYVYSDIHGNSRAAGSWDLGAYQLSASATAPNPPSGLTATTN